MWHLKSLAIPSSLKLLYHHTVLTWPLDYKGVCTPDENCPLLRFNGVTVHMQVLLFYGLNELVTLQTKPHPRVV